MASTTKAKQLFTPLLTIPDIKLQTPSGGYTIEPGLSILNDIMAMALTENFNWKWNRAQVSSFLTVALQQDYVTNITDLGWLEQGTRLDINNTAIPKPYWPVETSRDLAQTSVQQTSYYASFVPNTIATMGTWAALTSYPCGYGIAQTPTSRIQQFIDANGNILFINSNSLGLSLNSAGGTVTVGTPYGTSGAVQPLLAANSAAGTTVVDGTVTWTVASQNGYAIRLSPIPPSGGICYLMQLWYQKKPQILTSLDSVVPWPDEMIYLLRDGVRARGLSYAPSKAKESVLAEQIWMESLMRFKRGGDREAEECAFVPRGPVIGQQIGTATQIGPANPYGYDLYGPG